MLIGTLRNYAANSKVYSINLVNTGGQGSQALALSAEAGERGYYACQFLGYQGTYLPSDILRARHRTEALQTRS